MKDGRSGAKMSEAREKVDLLTTELSALANITDALEATDNLSLAQELFDKMWLDRHQQMCYYLCLLEESEWDDEESNFTDEDWEIIEEAANLWAQRKGLL